MRTGWLVSVSAAIPAAFAASNSSPAVADGGAAIEAELRALDSARLHLYATGRSDELRRLVDDDFRYTGANGDWLGKKEFVELQHRSPLVDVARTLDADVRTYGEVGVVIGAFAYRVQGERITIRYTDVYRRDERAWRLVNEQHSIVADVTQLAMNRVDDPFHAQWRGKEPLGSDDTILRELNSGYVQAFLDSNVAWYDAHLASDYRAVFGDGSLHDKGSLLAAAAHPVTNMQSFPTVSVTIRRFGDVALIHAENPYVRTDGLRGVNRYTDLWQKRDGRWACIGAHVTRHKLPA